MTTFTRDSISINVKQAASTASDFAVSTDGTLEMNVGASFAAAVTTVPPKSITITDPSTGVHYKIAVYVSGA